MMSPTGGLSRRLMLQAMTYGGIAALSGEALAQPVRSRKSNMRDWWQNDYRIVQTNLREIDVRQSPATIARSIRDFGGNVIVSNVGGIIAFYPTKLEYHYVNPFLEGDFVGEMIDAAHSNGLAYVGRFDLSKGMKAAYDAHPDWFVVNRDGTPRVYEGTYQACPNGGWAKVYAPAILQEALSRYKPDGVFFNLGGFTGYDYSNVTHGICVCDNCKRAFRAMFNRDLPKVEGFADPAWRDYLKFQERTSEEAAKVAAGIAEKLVPGAPILRWEGYTKAGRGEVQRRVSRPAPEWQYQAGEQSRIALARQPGLPFSSTSAAHIDYPWRQVTETADYHLNRFAQLLAVGTKLDLYLMGTLADQDDPSYLPPVSALFQWVAANSNHYQGASPAARIALYYSEASGKFASATPFARSAGGAFRGAYSALVDSRLPFQFASGDRAGDGTVDLRKAFDVIVAPHLLCLPATEARALAGFVDAGGLLIASGMFGGFDGEGLPLDHVPLPSFPTQAYSQPQAATGWSLDPSKGPFQFGAGRVPVDGQYFGGQLASDVETLVRFAPDQPFGPPELSYADASDPVRTIPGVMTRTAGSGRIVHIPWLYDWMYYRDGLPVHQDMLAQLIERYSPPQRWVLKGDGAVELSALRTASGQTLLHVINFAGQRNSRYNRPPALHNLSLGLRGGPSQVRTLVQGSTITASEVSEGVTWFPLPPLGAFEAILV